MDKTITVGKKEYKLSPLSLEEFKLFHGGDASDFATFKKRHSYKELRDFTNTDLKHAYVRMYDGEAEFAWDGYNWVIINSQPKRAM